MKIYNSIYEIDNTHKGAVIAIGNFDGVHRGHQILIDRAKTMAERLNAPFGILTFTPHPRQFFGGNDIEPFRLTSDHQKAILFETLCAADFTCFSPFDKELASLSAQDFIQQMLRDGAQVKGIVVGHDFCFGAKRQGTTQTLSTCGDFETEIIPALSDENKTIYSSSEIRHALRRGDLKSANALLGHEWEIEGTVVHGDKRGRELGYPTANMLLGEYLCPATGIYATFVKIEGENNWQQAATNIGIRPMFPAKEPLVETYLFDFDGDLYGKTLTVRPVQFLRGEAKFDSLDALTAQMAKDCEQARNILQNYS